MRSVTTQPIRYLHRKHPIRSAGVQLLSIVYSFPSSSSSRFYSASTTIRTSNSGTNGATKIYSPAIKHAAAIAGIVGKDNVIRSDQDGEMEKYTVDWTRSYRGGSLVCFPQTTEQVSSLLRFCNEEGVAVVCQGGNTGLVGGAVGSSAGQHQELILSLQKMRKIISIDPQAATVTAEAGVILEVLNNAVQEHGYVIPLDLGAKGSCCIGGNVSTNAGGLRVIKYGSMHSNVLGLEVVRADGTVLSNISRSLAKDNTGYHWKHLFIGSEGTLGVVTKVCMKLAVKPQSSYVILAKVPHFKDVPPTLDMVRRRLGENLSAFEFMDARSIAAVKRQSPQLLDRLSGNKDNGILPRESIFLQWKDWEGEKRNDSNRDSTIEGIEGEILILIEATGSDSEIDAMKIEKFLSYLIEGESDSEKRGSQRSRVIEAVLANDSQQEQALWSIREHVPVALMQSSRIREKESGYRGEREIVRKLFKYDISLTLEHTGDFLQELKQALHQLKEEREEDHEKDKVSHSFFNGFHVVGLSKKDDDCHVNDKKVETVLEFCNFGHAGDQNLHLNILAHISMPLHVNGSSSEISELPSSQEFIHFIHEKIDKHVFDLVIKRNGSISAEHGIGQQKTHILPQAKSGAELDLMRQMKTMMDPNNILNPGKIVTPFSSLGRSCFM